MPWKQSSEIKTSTTCLISWGRRWKWCKKRIKGFMWLVKVTMCFWEKGGKIPSNQVLKFGSKRKHLGEKKREINNTVKYWEKQTAWTKAGILKGENKWTVSSCHKSSSLCFFISGWIWIRTSKKEKEQNSLCHEPYTVIIYHNFFTEFINHKHLKRAPPSELSLPILRGPCS